MLTKPIGSAMPSARRHEPLGPPATLPCSVLPQKRSTLKKTRATSSTSDLRVKKYHNFIQSGGKIEKLVMKETTGSMAAEVEPDSDTLDRASRQSNMLAPPAGKKSNRTMSSDLERAGQRTLGSKQSEGKLLTNETEINFDGFDVAEPITGQGKIPKPAGYES